MTTTEFFCWDCTSFKAHGKLCKKRKFPTTDVVAIISFNKEVLPTSCRYFSGNKDVSRIKKNYNGNKRKK